MTITLPKYWTTHPRGPDVHVASQVKTLVECSQSWGQQLMNIAMTRIRYHNAHAAHHATRPECFGLHYLCVQVRTLDLAYPARIHKKVEYPAAFLRVQLANLLDLLLLQRAIALQCLLQHLLLDHEVRLGL